MKLSQFTVVADVCDGYLLFNTLNSGLIHLKEEEYKKLTEFMDYGENDSPKCKNAIISQLYEMNFVVDSERDEFKEVVDKYWAFRDSKDYIKVVIAPTTKCNFACKYCFEKGNYQSDMNVETARKIANELKHNLLQYNTNGLGLIWYGGEPLLKWNIIEELTENLHLFCKNSGISFTSSIVTNGFLINPDIIKELKQIGCTSIQITLDGGKEYHDNRRILKSGEGTYDTIISNIINCSNVLETTVRINIDKRNIQGIKRLLDEFVKAGLNDIIIFFAPIESNLIVRNDDIYTKEEFASIQMELLQYSLSIGLQKKLTLPTPNFGFCEAVSRNFYLFDPDGDNFLCWENVGRKEYSSSNKEKYLELRDYFVNTYSFHERVCEKCNVFPLCLGGCPQKKLDGAVETCSTLKYNIKDFLRLYYNYHIKGCQIK